MKISGFTFIKNGDKLYIPLKEAILSVLPICDEFIVAMGDNDPDDKTEEILRSINSDKIKIVKTVWDAASYAKNTIYAQQTDVAKEHCSGDWLFYIQCDEAIHEDDLPKVKSACKRYLNDTKVEGFLFKYLHFWGDYDHYHKNHSWYQREIRVIRNKPEIHSWRDAQSFRKFSKWEGKFEDYEKKEDSEKLNVKLLDCHIYHYGFVRPPLLLSKKIKLQSNTYRGDQETALMFKNHPDLYDYGPLNKLNVFKGSHPAVMKEWMAKHDWKNLLQYSGEVRKDRPIHQHEKPKYRIISWVENNLLGGKIIGGFKNYNLLKD
jgi:hypothetical protein